MSDTVFWIVLVTTLLVIVLLITKLAKDLKTEIELEAKLVEFQKQIRNKRLSEMPDGVGVRNWDSKMLKVGQRVVLNKPFYLKSFQGMEGEIVGADGKRQAFFDVKLDCCTAWVTLHRTEFELVKGSE